MRMPGLIFAVSLVCSLGMNTPIKAAGLNLSALGEEHAHSDGFEVTSMAFGFVPNAAGNAVFAGTAGLAVAAPGIAFGAGSGLAANLGAVIVLAVDASAVVIRTGPGGPLHAWGVGHADPAPDPFLNPFNDNDLLGIFGETGTIPVVPSLTQAQYDAERAAHPVSSSSPGSMSDFSAEVRFDDLADTISFDLSGNAILETSGLATFSTSLSLDSATLGIHRSFAFDESLAFAFQGGWGLSNLSTTQMGRRFEIVGDSLDFSVSVAPGFTLDDFHRVDLVLQQIDTADAVPEPSSLLLLGSGLAALIGFGRERLFKKT